LGLQHASHDWLTFCDPDDFFDQDYFSEVARAIRSHGEERVAMVSCNIINHYEASNLTRDDHYLRFKFAAGTQTIPAEDLGRFIQFNANSAFVSRRVLAEADLRFDVRVRPNFEDTHFIQRYLLTAR